MKSTGVIRRIDELGRIVIPKEIRKNLRIKDGENLEIFIADDNIILKKYSSVSNLKDISIELAESIYVTTKHNIMITDLDCVVAGAGSYKKNVMDKRIGKDIEKYIQKRETVFSDVRKEIEIVLDYSLDVCYIGCPIVVGGDVVGYIFLFNHDGIGETEKKLVSIASRFLGKYLES